MFIKKVERTVIPEKVPDAPAAKIKFKIIGNKTLVKEKIFFVISTDKLERSLTAEQTIKITIRILLLIHVLRVIHTVQRISAKTAANFIVP